MQCRAWPPGDTCKLITPDDIYESAFIAEKWPELLGNCAQIVSAIGGGFFTYNGDVQNWTASEAMRDTLSAFVKGRVIAGFRPRIAESEFQHRFFTEHDSYTDEELNAHPLYRDFLRPRGLGWSARTSVRLPTGDNFVINFERAYDKGPVTKKELKAVNALRPHLARAALMCARLQMERAQSTTQALAMLGLPALVFDSKSRVIAANHLIEAMTEEVNFRAFNNVTLTDARANVLLTNAMEAAAKETHTVPYSFSMCDSSGSPTRIAHVVPICGESRGIFVRSAGMLVLTHVGAIQMPSVDLVQSLFDLTAAEARVARSIAKGDTLEEISHSHGSSVNTVRAQLRSVLDKTGCRRQLEVAQLLNGLTIVRE